MLIRKEVKASGRTRQGVPFLVDSAGKRAQDVGKNAAAGSRLRFHYWDKGSLATIGRAAAVAEFGKIHISGFLAWLSWLFVHILFLIGFRNRILVFIQWAWSYVTYEKGARLITGGNYLPGWMPAIPAASSRANASGDSAPQPQEIHTGTAK